MNEMKNKVFDAISIMLLLFCTAVYVLLQIKLVPDLVIIPNYLNTLGNLTVPALFLVGLTHLSLLSNRLKTMDITFKTSLYVVVIILSGVFLFSDVAMLSDIGKEYLYWDVSSSFTILYGFTALHMITILISLFHHKNRQIQKPSMDIMYISVHQIGIICGVLGLLSGILAAFGGIVPQRFTIQLVIVLSVIAIVPLLFYIIYWVIKLRKKPINAWWDEKNIQDSAIGALLTLVFSVPIYLVIIIIKLCTAFEPSIVFWILAILFIQMWFYSACVLVRNAVTDLSE